MPPTVWVNHLNAVATSPKQEFIEFVRIMCQKYNLTPYQLTMHCLQLIATRTEWNDVANSSREESNVETNS